MVVKEADEQLVLIKAFNCIPDGVTDAEHRLLLFLFF